MKVRKRYFFYSVIFFILPFLGMLLYFHFLKRNCNFFTITKNLANKFADISGTFSLTMLGFLIASFSLIQLIQSKEWYEAVYKSVPFQSFLHRLWLSIIYLIIHFGCSIISFLLIEILPKEFFQWIISVLIGIFGYVLSWITLCMIDYIKIITD
ncbi:MAG: hypothetical protein J6K96_08620 [Treponema sp.]|nr:hypothetical protein [Treponema sp.]